MSLPIDLEAERIQLDGAWVTSDELSARITQLIAAKDFRIAKLSDALEQLAAALAGARSITLKLTGDHFAKLEAAGQKLGKTADQFARDLLMQVLLSGPQSTASAPAAAPVAVAPPVLAASAGAPPVLANSDVTAEEAAGALTIQPKRRDSAAYGTPPVMTPINTPVVAAPGAPVPSVVVDLGPGDGKQPPGGDPRRWFNRT